MNAAICSYYINSSVMNFFVKNMLFDSVPFKVHFTEINTPKGEKLLVFTSDRQEDTYPFSMGKNGSDWRIVNAPSATALFFKNEERFPEQ
jgi:hypothetical protein